jgi:hypothetical protein
MLFVAPSNHQVDDGSHGWRLRRDGLFGDAKSARNGASALRVQRGDVLAVVSGDGEQLTRDSCKLDIESYRTAE